MTDRKEDELVDHSDKDNPDAMLVSEKHKQDFIHTDEYSDVSQEDKNLPGPSHDNNTADYRDRRSSSRKSVGRSSRSSRSSRKDDR